MKIAIITGASSGMGRETARELAARYYFLDCIWLIARRRERLEELAKELKTEYQTNCRIIVGDVSDKEFLEDYKHLLEVEKPNVKILVNASGFGKYGKFQDASLEEQLDMVRVNCEGLTAITGLTLPYITHNSRIMNYASIAAYIAQPNFTVYCATKAYVLSYTRALNAELRKKCIYCTAVCPGPVKTEFFDIAESGSKKPVFKKFFMANPQKVVRLAIYDTIHKKQVSVYGSTMKLLRVTSKLVPGELLTMAAGLIAK